MIGDVVVARIFRPVANGGASVEKTIELLTYIERLAKGLREKVEKEQVSAPWLLERVQKSAIELNLVLPYLTAKTAPKKFEPSKKEEKE